MRAILILGMMATANGDCTLHSSKAVGHGIEAALYVWAATKRCTGAVLEEAGVKCEQDVTAAIEEVVAMANDIADMVAQCNDIKDDNHKCASLVTDLVSKTAGLAHDGGALADQCGKVIKDPKLDTQARYRSHSAKGLGRKEWLGGCTVYSGLAMNSLFWANNAIKGAKQNCGKDGSKGSCTTSSLNVLSVISNMGAFLGHSVSKCKSYAASQADPKNWNAGSEVDTYAEDCAASVLESIADLTGVAKIGLQLKDACFVSDARLFIENGSTEVTEPAGSNLIVFGLAAMVPIAAVLSFIAGNRFAKARRQTRVYDPMALESQEAPIVE